VYDISSVRHPVSGEMKRRYLAKWQQSELNVSFSAVALIRQLISWFAAGRSFVTLNAIQFLASPPVVLSRNSIQRNYSRRQSRGSISFIRVCLCVCLSVCPHDRTKTAETTITCHSDSILWIKATHLLLGQDHRVTKCKNIFQAIEWPA